MFEMLRNFKKCKHWKSVIQTKGKTDLNKNFGNKEHIENNLKLNFKKKEKYIIAILFRQYCLNVPTILSQCFSVETLGC